MEIISEWIQKDIVSDILSVGFKVENALISSPAAVTVLNPALVIFNSKLVTLFELAEEYIHAREHHHRRCAEYDVRNPDEIEAHHLAIEYLIALGEKYDCPRDWQQFMIATGTPAHLRDYVIEQYNNSPDGVLFKTVL